jgi:hypothetical protein
MANDLTTANSNLLKDSSWQRYVRIWLLDRVAITDSLWANK